MTIDLDNDSCDKPNGGRRVLVLNCTLEKARGICILDEDCLQTSTDDALIRPLVACLFCYGSN